MTEGIATPSSGLAWQPARPADLDAIMAIQGQVHTLLPERLEVFAAKLALCPEGCGILTAGTAALGYGFTHPWLLGSVPPLDTVIAALPAAPDCLFLHDVALLPAARGRGAGRAYVAAMRALAAARDLEALALVSVYDSLPVWEACGFQTRAAESGLRQKLASYGETARYMVFPLRPEHEASGAS